MLREEKAQYLHIIQLHMPIIWSCQNELWIRGKAQWPDAHGMACK